MGRLNKTSPVVKWDEISRSLLERIAGSVYKAGDFLPPERMLAEEYGVSRPTLRKALGPLFESGKLINHPGVGTQVAAAAGRERKTSRGRNWRVIGLLIPDFDNQFFIEITEAIEYTALQRGYQVLLCNSRHEAAIEETHIRQLAEQCVDGVILAHDPHMPFPAAVSFLKESRIPYVALFDAPSVVECDSVAIDNYAGVNQAMHYLSSLGHRDIAFCRPIHGNNPHPREKAYLRYMEQNHELPPQRFLIPLEALEENGDKKALLQVFQQPPIPTAVLAGNDRTALLILKYLASIAIDVPRDISVIGFDNLRFTEHLPVALTTVDQPKQEMGRRAVELLLEHIEMGSSSDSRVDIFQPRLIIRESCALFRMPSSGITSSTMLAAEMPAKL